MEQRSKTVKDLALASGFDYCGISEARFLDEDARRLEQWLNKGYHGKMAYMENHFDLRTNPAKLVEGAKSVITLLKNYYPSEQQQEDAPKIAKYAWGTDYHFVIREQLNSLLQQIGESIGEINGRGFVDSAPVLERSWALESGLGWIGKNGNLITKQQGSFFFIATLITDLALQPDDAFAKDYCGSCKRCIEACPTGAIIEPSLVDGSRCISYLTIELKADADVPDAFNGQSQGWAFGCDICQDVCPWNRFSKPHHEPHFNPVQEILNLSTKEWEQMAESDFNKILKNSPIKRPKYKGFIRNLKWMKMEGGL